VSGYEGGTVVGFKAGEEGIEHFSPRNDDDIKALAWLVPPEDLAGKTLRAVAIDRRSQLACGRHAEAGHRSAVRHYEHRHVASLDPGTGRVRAFEIGAAPDVLGPAEPLAGHAHRLERLPLVGDRQPLAPLGATPLENDAPVLRGHTDPEAVRFLSATLVRLICALALHVPRCLNWTKLRS